MLREIGCFEMLAMVRFPWALLSNPGGDNLIPAMAALEPYVRSDPRAEERASAQFSAAADLPDSGV